MWIDTHCHLDVEDFDADRGAVVQRARAAGVSMIVVPAIVAGTFSRVARCAAEHDGAYALGIHPLYVDKASEEDVERLREAARAALNDPRFVAIGEIGIDLHVPGLDVARQEWFYREQLRVARDLGLPVILHVRRSADVLLRHLNRIEVSGGIAHAFNGSEDQALRLVERGLRLGFGGAMTYNGSLRIRRHAAGLPDTAWVLETDAPDIPPEWMRLAGGTLRNEPAELARIAQVMAMLRQIPLSQVAALGRANAVAALPRLLPLLEHAPATDAPVTRTAANDAPASDAPA
jgi:TatD DNase family protein